MLLCACGCGQPKRLSVNGKMRGRFIRGHMFYALRRPLGERLWARTTKTEGCWLWDGSRNRDGYGTIGNGNTGSMLTHRAAWIVTNGPIPAGLNVCHSCDNPRCVRPDHLFLGTQYDNIQDCYAKGRDRWSRAMAEAN